MRASALAALLSLAPAACGGAAADDTTTTAPPDTATTATAAADDNSDDTPESGGDGLECLEASQAMAAAMASYGAGFAQATAGSLDEESLQQAAEQLEAMAGAAPEEIKDDLQVIVDQLEAFYTALADMGYEPGETPTQEQIEELSSLAEIFDNEAFEEASDNINAWFDANC